MQPIEPDQRAPALALATPQGVTATPAFLAELGLEPPPPGARTLEAWLEPLGFAGEPGALARGGRRILRSTEGLPPGSEIAWPEEPAPDERARRARFLRMAAHDLRGPVANVRAFVSLLRTPEVTLTPRTERALETIERSATRALAMLEDYFASAQAAEGQLAIEPAAADLSPLIRVAAEEASGTARARGVAVEVEELGALPPAWVEPIAFRHALDSLLAWAIDRAPANQRVRIGAQRRAEAIELRLTGAGPPLSPEERSHVFDREFWVEREGGLRHGFRLAAAAAEVRAMGGEARLLDEGEAAPGISLRVRIVSA